MESHQRARPPGRAAFAVRGLSSADTARPGRLSGMRSVRTALLTALATAALTLTGCATSATGSPVGATSNGAGTTALPAPLTRWCG